MTAPITKAVSVREIETVTGDFMQDKGEPFWRIEIDGYADFDYKEAADNFAARINEAFAKAIAEEQERCARIAEAYPMGDVGKPHGEAIARRIRAPHTAGDE